MKTPSPAVFLFIGLFKINLKIRTQLFLFLFCFREFGDNTQMTFADILYISDLQQYFESVLIPNLYNLDQNAYNIKVPSENVENEKKEHFLNTFNYFSGMRLTLNNMVRGSNEDEHYNTVRKDL